MICLRRLWSSVDVSVSNSLRKDVDESVRSWKDVIVELSAVIFSRRL